MELRLLIQIFQSCKNDLKEAPKLIDKSALNTERADDVTILYSKNGHTSAKLFTPKFNHVQNVNTRNINSVAFYSIDKVIRGSIAREGHISIG